MDHSVSPQTVAMVEPLQAVKTKVYLKYVSNPVKMNHGLCGAWLDSATQAGHSATQLLNEY